MIQKYPHKYQGDFNSYHIDVGDGEVEMYADGLEPGGRLTMLDPTDELLAHLPANVLDFEQVPIRSGKDVIEALRAQFGDWKAYRDRAVGEGEQSRG